MQTLLGIDIGGTKIAGGVVDAQTGTVLVAHRIPTQAAKGGQAVLGRALAVGRNLMERAQASGVPRPMGIGIGAGGQINHETGVVLSATDILPGWAGTALAPAFADAFGLPAWADNDVNALALGEHRWGAGRGRANLVFLALGTGVGGALILGGQLYRSASSGVSGELGHLILDPNGPLTHSGTQGSLEEYASGPALLRTYRALGGQASAGNDPPPFALLAAQNPNGPAARAVTQTGEMLGVGLASLANLFGPDAFIIGGGLASLGDLLLGPARRVLAVRALPPVRLVPVVPAALGSDASVAGAAALALFSPSPLPQATQA